MSEDIQQDARKSLDQLNDEWEQCRRCALGVQREGCGGEFVRGEGRTRGIMFVGEGPGKDEEASGRPFVGKSGQILRGILDQLKFEDYYISNLVTCRSCEPRLDESNQPMFRGRGGNKYMLMMDTPPKPAEWNQCIQRLFQEIYIVDPILIVSLGGTATEALLGGKSVTITSIHGQAQKIEIPGAGWEAKLTEKKGVWYRKIRGEVQAPMERAKVEYLLVPTLHPAFVLRKISDQGHNSPFKLLVNDIRRAIETYEMYLREVFNVDVPERNAPEEIEPNAFEDD